MGAMGRLTLLSQVLGLALFLGGCAPLAPGGPATPYPGGFAQGSLVTGRFQVILPGPPLFLDAGEETLYAAYPYQLLTFRRGSWDSLPLPGVPRFLRVQPALVVGLSESVYTEAGLLPYPATDATLTERGLFWVGSGGLYRERVLLQKGEFRQVVAWEGRVVALGQEAYFYPEGYRVPLPRPTVKAQTGACGVVALLGGETYLVRPEGAKPLAPASDFATKGEAVYLVPGERVVSCKEVVWP